MFRLLCTALLLAYVSAGDYLYDGQYNYNTEYAAHYDNYKPRDYKFEYGVSDPHTGDHKSQWEVRENGVVRGAYSLLEPDGTTRVVEYYADDTGFHADVKKIGHAVHPEQHVTPIIKTHIADSIAYNGYGHGGLDHNYGAPIAAIQHVAPIEHQVLPEPIQHIAPIANIQHIAPVQQVIAPQLLERYAPSHYNIAPLQKSYPELYQQDAYIQELTKQINIQPEIHIQKQAHIETPLQYIQEAHIPKAQPIHIQPEVQFAKPLYPEPIQYNHPIIAQRAYVQAKPQYELPVQQYVQEAPQIIKQAPIIAKEQYTPYPEIYQQQPIQLKYPETVIKSAPIPIAKEQYQLYQQPIELNQVARSYYQQDVHQPHIAPPQYVQETKAVPKYEQYSAIEPNYYQVEKPTQKQQYNPISQIDEAILKYLSQAQLQQPQQEQPAPYYGLNHGN